MPPKEGNTICVDCKKTECLLWTKVELGQICQECFQQRATKESTDNIKSAEEKEDSKIEETKDTDNKETVTKSENKNVTNTAVTIEEKRLRKSTRATRFKAKQNINVGSGSNVSNGNAEKNSSSGGGTGSGAGGGNTKNLCKGRNRRSVFKRTPFKTPASQATTHCVESLFYKGSYMQIGDIVSLVDGRDNIFYAQIRGLMVDNYCEKSAFLTWLIPTQESPDPKEGFDAATYLIGPDEELSRKLSCLEFVMHAPSNYYLDRSTPFPLPDEMEFNARPGGYIWTTLPEIQRNKATVPSSI